MAIPQDVSPITRALAACALALALAACSGGGNGGGGNEAGASASGGSEATASAADLDPVLAEPQVGDLYAAELTHFSGVDFGGAENGEPAYGLMKVVAVTDERVTLNTEMGAWPKPRGAVNELRGDLSNIQWDEQEKIEIYRNELPKLVAEEKILEARRM
ncbi:hypothetical protein [Luteimonas huabeiensis]|uniref:hypothetical protein n=1 Tax=Luteimonas huabeiensis TaxID=1244513 RepID=UPI0004634750|nr:hypothetical protein [Luteimonas huabeiensis]